MSILKVIRRDEYNRIMQIEIGGSTNGGHSVCTHCGKDMPSIWDTVCFKCGRTLCYNCSHEKNGHWYCEVHK